MFFFFLQHIVEHTLKEETKSKEVLQSNFDLLAELMKFNRTAYKRFEGIVNTEEVVSDGWARNLV